MPNKTVNAGDYNRLHEELIKEQKIVDNLSRRNLQLARENDELRCKKEHQCAEAEDLRRELEKLLQDDTDMIMGHEMVYASDIREILEEVDARDSLKYLQEQDKRNEKNNNNSQNSTCKESCQ